MCIPLYQSSYDVEMLARGKSGLSRLGMPPWASQTAGTSLLGFQTSVIGEDRDGAEADDWVGAIASTIVSSRQWPKQAKTT
jgi:hypothetical protein